MLEAILFCIVDCNLDPRIATERLDSGEIRLDKIVQLIRESRFSIHDLSRVQSTSSGELARLNMPFELGVAFGIAISDKGPTSSKRLLIIAEDRYLYQAALSDIAGWDILPHGGEFEKAIKQTRAWLQSHGLAERSNSQILGDYWSFQAWDYERLLSDGWNETDIQERETGELLEAMKAWRAGGRPQTFS